MSTVASIQNARAQIDDYALATDWGQHKLEDLSAKLITYGIVQPGPHIPNGVPFIQTRDLEAQTLDLRAMDRTSEGIHAAYARSAVFPGDILIGIRASVGRVADVPSELREANISRGVARISPNGKVDGRYLFWALQGPIVVSNIGKSVKGSTYSELTLPALRSVEVPIPPLAEQRAIASALSDVDELIGALDKLIAKKRAIKLATMQQLLTGKTRLPGFAKSREQTLTDLGRIPRDWRVVRLRECLRKAPAYGINAAAVPFDGSLPTYLRITDIDEHGQFRPSPKVCVRHPKSQQYLLEEDDLVFARTGASVGKSYKYQPSDGPLVFAGFLIRITPDAIHLDTGYLSHYVQSKSYWDWVAKMSARSGQPGINGQEYAELLLPLPEISEQRAISKTISDMDTEIASLEQRRDKTKAIKKGMMQSLLTGRVRLVTP